MHRKCEGPWWRLGLVDGGGEIHFQPPWSLPPPAEAHRGRVVTLMGDGLLVESHSIVGTGLEAAWPGLPLLHDRDGSPGPRAFRDLIMGEAHSG